MVAKFFVLAILVSVVIVSCGAHDSGLKSVHFIFRHGEKNPDSSYNAVNCRLTEKGKKQMYYLGLYIRERYSDFLNQELYPEEVRIITSDTHRNIRSAGLVTYGLYEDFYSAANWNGENGPVPYEPIPVRTIPPELDRYLQPKVPCPKLYQLWMSTITPFLDGLLERHGDLLHTYANATGDNNLENKNLTVSIRAEKLLSFVEQVQFNSTHGLPLKDWAIEMMELDDFRYFVLKLFQSQFELPEERKLYGGSLLGLVVEDFLSQSPTKMNLYEGHDRVIYAVMSLLGIYDTFSFNSPPLASALIFELHEDPKNEQHEFVKIFYRNDTTVQPQERELQNCSDPCLLSEFLRLTKDLIPVNYQKECEANGGRLLLGEETSAKTSFDRSGGILMYGTGAAAIICLVVALTFFIAARNNKHYFPG